MTVSPRVGADREIVADPRQRDFVGSEVICVGARKAGNRQCGGERQGGIMLKTTTVA
jgi:hypothetical protein